MTSSDPKAEEVLPGIVLRRARPDDATRFVALHEDAAHWLWDRGIHQWKPGVFQEAWIAKPIARGEVFLAWRGEVVVGAVVLEWEDTWTWGPRPNDAGYIHGLRVARSAARLGLGRALLTWAEGGIARAGRPFARLDCIAENADLVAYYVRAGYTHLDDVTLSDEYGEHRLTRFEKRVGAPTSAR